MTVTLSTKLNIKNISQLIRKMTLDEKLAQLGSCWIFELQSKGTLDADRMAGRLKDGIGQITRLGGASTMDPASAAKAANRIQKFLVDETRLGIPAIVHEESCSGAMVLGGTNFPQMLGLASTFEPGLARRMADAIRRQLRAIGAHQGLAPVLDVSRDLRWGRVEETFGEDPTLVGHFGCAYVRGLQGDSTLTGILATGKHFVGHSLSLGGLNCAPVQLGERELWNSFLSPFHAAIRDADLATIMCAYPEVDGEVVAASHAYLTEILRDKLGFDGLLVSDYNAVNMIHDYHFAAPDLPTAAALALHAGVDVELPTTYCYGDPLRAALEAGQIDIECVDNAVARHMKKKMELGLFDNPYVDEGRVLELFDATAAEKLAYEIAAKTVVLLKNDGLLPLRKDLGTLAVIGPNADNARSQLSDYSYASVLDRVRLDPAENSSFVEADWDSLTPLATHAITVLDGIRAVISARTNVLYAEGCKNLGNDRGGFDEALAAAQQAEAVILVLGDYSGLTVDSTTGETRDSVDLKLPGVQGELAQAVIALGKPVAIVLVNGRPFAEPWLDEHANAILEAWLPGEQGGAAVADILFGRVNPGGKLPVSIPRHVGQSPIFYNHKPSGMHSNWHGDYVQESAAPLYPFGHGLSYTKFEYRSLSISQVRVNAGETVMISAEVQNIGKVSGDEVVQLYTKDPFASSPRPVQELRGYVRLTLQPGQTRRIAFHLPVNQLAFFGLNLELVLEPGQIEVSLGSSSSDIRLRGEFEIGRGAVIPLEERIFDCPVEVG
ncbi:MAG: glycoside hydrolase family 3 N-terminal domain-containing protein [Anaerolineales bacterium]